jgi:hypothetical protein
MSDLLRALKAAESPYTNWFTRCIDLIAMREAVGEDGFREYVALNRAWREVCRVN